MEHTSQIKAFEVRGELGFMGRKGEEWRKISWNLGASRLQKTCSHKNTPPGVSPVKKKTKKKTTMPGATRKTKAGAICRSKNIGVI